MRGRMVRRLLLITVLLAGLLSASNGAGAVQTADFSLAAGDAAFWSGPGDAATCGSNCWRYTLEVTESAYRLRVGIDRPRLQDVWTARLFAPSGGQVGAFGPGTELYSAEITRANPAPGVYTVEVTAGSVTDRRFRMRAALETDNGGLPTGRVEVPPNLRPLPPWDFSFLLSVTNGSTGGPSTGVAVPTGRVACHAEEVALYKAVRCLRMSFGVANAGLGPLELELGAGTQFMDRPLIQAVRNADGSTVTRDAGNAYFHHSHSHYHHDRAIGLQLLKVTNETTGTLASAGEPLRKGFAHRDELLRDWTSFAPTWSKRGFGLLPGWGDYYEWDRPGNYIDFGLNEDGLYVVRISADPDGFIAETTRANNVAYSLVRVTGETVHHLESGMGTDPWDPCRTPLPLGPEFTDSFQMPAPRPENCPE